MNHNVPFFLFDDECKLCLRFVQLLKTLPGYEDFQFLPISEKDNIDSLKNYPEEELKKNLHIFYDHKNHIGPRAIEFLIKRNPVIKKHFWLLDNAMGKKSLKLFYTAINKARKTSVLCGGCSK